MKYFNDKQNNYFYTSFDKWIMQEPELMLETNGEQAKNLPDEMDTLVMSCGVGIQMSAVMYGIKKADTEVKKSTKNVLKSSDAKIGINFLAGKEKKINFKG